MRPALLLGGLLALLAGAVIAVAQTGSGPAAPAAPPAKEMTVTHEIEVRCGGGPAYYATTKLRPGDKVVVMGESQQFKGWLAIKPPPGSFSWINALFVKRGTPPGGVVAGSPLDEAIAPVLAGSSLASQRPNVEMVRLKPGAQVVILGDPKYDTDGAWLPIQPTPQEVRYIPVDAVQNSGTPVAAAPVPTPGAGPITSAPPNPARQLRDRADQAYAAGNIVQAKALYEQAANQTTDLSEKSYCYNRLHQIATAGQPANYAQPGHPANSSAPGQVTSLYGTGPAPVTPAAAAPTATPVSYAASPPQWKWGILQRTTITKDGRPMYVLLDRNGQVLMYAVSPNTSLEHYLNRLVCLYGPLTYSPGDYLRLTYMTVSQVALP